MADASKIAAGWYTHPGTNKTAWWDGEKWDNPPPDAVPRRNQNAVNAFGAGLFSVLFLFLPLVGVHFFAPVTAAISFGYGVATIATAKKYEHRGLVLGLFGLMLAIITFIFVGNALF